MQFCNKMCSFAYNSSGKASSYITRTIIRKRRLVKISKKFDPEKETAKGPVVIEKDTRQDTNRSF